MKKWRISFWDNEYTVSITVTALNVVKTGDQTVCADGVEINVHEEIISIQCEE